MLTIHTSTCCRPDLVQLLADALAVTAPRPYRFIVQVHAGGLRREWSNVSEVVESTQANMAAIQEITDIRGGGLHMLVHDDCLPMRTWSIVPGMRREDDGLTLVTWEDRWRPANVPVDVRRGAADWWPPEVRELAEACRVESLLCGDWLHLDKSTLWHPDAAVNRGKDDLLASYCKHLGIRPHVPLTAHEAAAHPGARHGGEYPAGLGDMVAVGLSAVGITPERIQAITGKPCGCEERKRLLNEAGARWLGIGRVDPPGR